MFLKFFMQQSCFQIALLNCSFFLPSPVTARYLSLSLPHPQPAPQPGAWLLCFERVLPSLQEKVWGAPRVQVRPGHALTCCSDRVVRARPELPADGGILTEEPQLGRHRPGLLPSGARLKGQGRKGDFSEDQALTLVWSCTDPPRHLVLGLVQPHKSGGQNIVLPPPFQKGLVLRRSWTWTFVLPWGSSHRLFGCFSLCAPPPHVFLNH